MAYIECSVALMNFPKEKRSRNIGAWLCLFAMLLFYTPLAGAMCAARAGSCCTNGFCPIASHHHQHTSHPQPANDMQCEHGGAGFSSCAMDCCHRAEQSAVNAIWLVPPAPLVLSFGNPQSTPVRTIDSSANFLNQAPDSPPPRLPFG